VARIRRDHSFPDLFVSFIWVGFSLRRLLFERPGARIDLLVFEVSEDLEDRLSFGDYREDLPLRVAGGS
jgi:hypothetical protein